MPIFLILKKLYTLPISPLSKQMVPRPSFLLWISWQEIGQGCVRGTNFTKQQGDTSTLCIEFLTEMQKQIRNGSFCSHIKWRWKPNMSYIYILCIHEGSYCSHIKWRPKPTISYKLIHIHICMYLSTSLALYLSLPPFYHN